MCFPTLSIAKLTELSNDAAPEKEDVPVNCDGPNVLNATVFELVPICNPDDGVVEAPMTAPFVTDKDVQANRPALFCAFVVNDSAVS